MNKISKIVNKSFIKTIILNENKMLKLKINNINNENKFLKLKINNISNENKLLKFKIDEEDFRINSKILLAEIHIIVIGLITSYIVYKKL